MSDKTELTLDELIDKYISEYEGRDSFNFLHPKNAETIAKEWANIVTKEQSQLIKKLKQKIEELKTQNIWLNRNNTVLRGNESYYKNRLNEKHLEDLKSYEECRNNRLELTSQLKAKSDMCDKLAADLKWFCDRVDNKEIRSMRTYARFKNSLTQYNQTK